MFTLDSRTRMFANVAGDIPTVHRCTRTEKNASRTNLRTIPLNLEENIIIEMNS